jgi:hypothetical protein
VEEIGREDVPARIPVQAIIAFDANKTSATNIEQRLNPFIAATGGRVEVEYLPAPGLNYYEQKNFAATRARGEILMFADCDIYVEHGWPKKLLAPFRDPECLLTAGITMMRTEGLMNRAAALYWTFPTELDEDKPAVLQQTNANNFAIRAELFRRIQFPRHAGMRIQCTYWAERLKTEGISPVWVIEAGALHPSFDNISELAKRAWLYGKDSDIHATLAGKGRFGRLRYAFSVFRKTRRRMLRRMRKFWKPMHIRLWEAPLLLGLGFTFAGTALIAQLLSAATATHERPVFETSTLKPVS